MSNHLPYNPSNPLTKRSAYIRPAGNHITPTAQKHEHSEQQRGQARRIRLMIRDLRHLSHRLLWENPDAFDPDRVPQIAKAIDR